MGLFLFVGIPVLTIFLLNYNETLLNIYVFNETWQFKVETMFKNFTLSKKNLIIFGVILLIFIVNQTFVLWVQSSSDESSLDAINASGRNRMLSQRISAASFQILSGNEKAIEDLRGAIAWFYIKRFKKWRDCA